MMFMYLTVPGEKKLRHAFSERLVEKGVWFFFKGIFLGFCALIYRTQHRACLHLDSEDSADLKTLSGKREGKKKNQSILHLSEPLSQ